MLTVREAAEKYRLNESTITKAAKEGKIKRDFKKNSRGRPLLLLDEESLVHWDQTRPKYKPKPMLEPDDEKVPTEIKPCPLKPKQRVKFNFHSDERKTSMPVKGTVVDKTDHLVVVKTDLGFKTCFTDYDYHKGTVKEAEG